MMVCVCYWYEQIYIWMHWYFAILDFDTPSQFLFLWDGGVDDDNQELSRSQMTFASHLLCSFFYFCFFWLLLFIFPHPKLAAVPLLAHVHTFTLFPNEPIGSGLRLTFFFNALWESYECVSKISSCETCLPKNFGAAEGAQPLHRFFFFLQHWPVRAAGRQLVHKVRRRLFLLLLAIWNPQKGKFFEASKAYTPWATYGMCPVCVFFCAAFLRCCSLVWLLQLLVLCLCACEPGVAPRIFSLLIEAIPGAKKTLSRVCVCVCVWKVFHFCRRLFFYLPAAVIFDCPKYIAPMELFFSPHICLVVVFCVFWFCILLFFCELPFLFSPNPFVFVMRQFRYWNGHNVQIFFSCPFDRFIGLFLLLIHQQSFSPLTAFLPLRLEKKLSRFPINIVGVLIVCAALLHQNFSLPLLFGFF